MIHLRAAARCFSSRQQSAANKFSSRVWQDNKKKSLGKLSFFSSTTRTNNDNLVLTNMNEETQIATITMNRPPANSLSLEMCQAISKAIHGIEENPNMQGLIVSSNLSNIFCAGLDLTELHQPDAAERLPQFWKSFQQLYLDLYGSRLATVAAMGGHAPAAGCMLALSCDYRIMSALPIDCYSKKKNPTIGLNESQLGIVAPPWLAQQYIDTIGLRNAELALSLGTLYDTQEAHRIGLVDQVVMINNEDNDGDDVVIDDNERVIQVAKEQLSKYWIPIPPQARVATKKLTRQRQIQQLIDTRDADCDHFCSFVTQETVQQDLGAYLERLMKKKKKKKKK